MGTVALPVEAAGGGSRLFRALLARKAVTAGLLVLALVLLVAVLGPFLSPYAPGKLSLISRLKPPSAAHFLGTDDFGRDVFTRLAVAGRLSLGLGFAVVVVSGLIGVTLGLLAGFFRQLDPPLARLIDAMMAFPDILLAISLVAALGASTVNVVAALGIVYAPRLARIVRASTLVIRELPYVEAARALGVSTPRILVRHVLRNLLSPIMVQATFVFANAMLAEAGLSFLGVGVAPSVPTWGTMIAQGRQYLDQAPWIMFFPGLVVVLAVLALQLVGDGLRDLLDPRLAKDF